MGYSPYTTGGFPLHTFFKGMLCSLNLTLKFLLHKFMSEYLARLCKDAKMIVLVNIPVMKGRIAT